MPKIGPINFPYEVIDALREANLVVFAGAGVSRGSPSNLPLFEALAREIALGTELSPEPDEPTDRFLGRLQHRKVAVHDRAAQRLTVAATAPTVLHADLLRLFGERERVKLVTTNFDLHFEAAAQTIFSDPPDVYQGPALPLGSDFDGIVHVHGSVTKPQSMILTDADFGRAYLTEGWARRFLLEVFRNYTVLFVGYSHSDVVMNYLARALPADMSASRFALTEEDGNWEFLGIHPIRFSRFEGDNAFIELHQGVARLADRMSRGALDWRSRLSEIADRTPPADADEEAGDEIDQALREMHTTRFFTSIARHAEWPRWLDSRKYLAELFTGSELTQRDQLVAGWLAKHYAAAHASELQEIIIAHGLTLNQTFWSFISCELGSFKEEREDNSLSDSALNRWISILLASAPSGADSYALIALATRCGKHNQVQTALRVFLFMCEHRTKVKAGFVWNDQRESEHGRPVVVEYPARVDHWGLNEVWTKQLRPHLPSIGRALITGVVEKLERIHDDLSAWQQASRRLDPVSYGRSAIEPSDQDNNAEPTDVLIDAARDTLESFANNDPAALDAWIEILIVSAAPILRRLAIHGISVHPAKCADDRLQWLLARVGLNEIAEHHEIHRAIAMAYPMVGAEARQGLIEAVFAIQPSPRDDRSPEEQLAKIRFDWLSWLHQADPKCSFVAEALAPIKAEHAGWRQSSHPDFTHWLEVGWVGARSPRSAQELLGRPPGEQLNDLLHFSGNSFDGPDRNGLITAINEACKQQPAWAFSLADALAERSLWTSDLWPAVIRGWQESELQVEGWRSIFTVVANHELQLVHSHEISSLLYSMVADGGKQFALELLPEGNTVALSIWQGLVEHEEKTTDWLSRAINRPAGVIVEYWVTGLSLLMRGKEERERKLFDEYRQLFEMVLRDPSIKGGLGRTVLASQVGFLFGLDEAWSRLHIVPLFRDPDRQIFRQSWDGFLVWGRLYPTLSDALAPMFVQAFPRIGSDVPRRDRFIEFCASLAVFYADDPRRDLLPALFKNGSTVDRVIFSSRVGQLLRHMQENAIQTLWDRWLFRYWQDRQQAVPAPLDEREIEKMLEWLPHLTSVFPAAVSLAIASPPIRIQHSHLLWELRDSELVLRFPNDAAKLLAYLCACNFPNYALTDLDAVVQRLVGVESELKTQLDEALARAGGAP